MGMTYPYCNTTSDLERVFRDIEKFNGLETVETFTLASGQTNTYQKNDVGYVGVCYQNGTALTSRTSIALTETNAGSFYYDSTNDILYVHSTDNADPDTHTIKIGVEAFGTFKTTMSERAFQQLESMLDSKYPRPLPFAEYSYNSYKYDDDIVECAAILTCVNIIKYRDPENPLVKILMDMVYNPSEEIGVLWQYKQGHRAFTFEATTDEFNGNITPVSLDNASTGKIWIVGNGDRTGRLKIKLLIVTGGAVRTATFKYSLDGGTSYTSDITTNFQYIPILANLYLKFQGTFVANDEWEINVLGDPEKNIGSRIKSVEFRRF